MLTEQDFIKIEKQAAGIYQNLELQIIEEIAKRIANVGYANTVVINDLKIAQEMGYLYEDIIKLVAKYNNTTVEEVNRIFYEAGEKSLKFDDKIYKEAGLVPIPIQQSENIKQIMNATIVKTAGNLQNLCMTTASTSQTQFYNAINNAYMYTSTGVKSYTQAIIDEVKKIGQQGAVIQYPSGAKRSIESAIRMNIITSVNQTMGTLQETRANELGWDLMELTAHGGARPSHANWQGKIVSRSGQKGYLSLRDIGYGDATGFKGINCRHDWYPYYKGSSITYTQEQLNTWKNEKVTYNGKEYSKYDATQLQRSMERQIRVDKKELAGLQGILTSNSKDSKLIEDTKAQLITKQSKLKEHNSILNNFINQTNSKKDDTRLYIGKASKVLSNDNKNNKTLEKIPNNIKDFYNYISKNNKLENLTTFKRNEIDGVVRGKELNKILGYDKLPTIVSKEEFEKLAEQSSIGKLYRGVQAETKELGIKYVNDFKYGQLYAGKGVYGNGTYAAYGEEGIKIVKSNYTNEKGNIMTMLLDKNAKTINFVELDKMRRKEIEALGDNISENFKNAMLMDNGYYASIKGYDAIILDKTIADLNNQPYVVILNRGKVIMSE